MASVIQNFFSESHPYLASFLSLSVFLVTSLRLVRSAYARGFAAGAGRAADIAKNGFNNLNHPIHQLYKKG
jgi:hypothetical protein